MWKHFLISYITLLSWSKTKVRFNNIKDTQYLNIYNLVICWKLFTTRKTTTSRCLLRFHILLIFHIKHLSRQFYPFLNKDWVFECYFMKNDYKIIVKCRWWSEYAVSSTAAHGRALVGVQVVKSLKRFDLFTSGGQMNNLKYKTHRKR